MAKRPILANVHILHNDNLIETSGIFGHHVDLVRLAAPAAFRYTRSTPPLGGVTEVDDD